MTRSRKRGQEKPLAVRQDERQARLQAEIKLQAEHQALMVEILAGTDMVKAWNDLLQSKDRWVRTKARKYLMVRGWLCDTCAGLHAIPEMLPSNARSGVESRKESK